MITVDYAPVRKLFALSFPFHPQAVDWVRAAPERRWMDKAKAWVLPRTFKVLEYLRASPFEMSWTPEAEAAARAIEEECAQLETHLMRAEAPCASPDAYDGYVPKTPPRRYQVEAFELAKDRECFGLFFEQGLGKTKAAIDLCSYWLQRGVINKVIILCPNFVKGVWVDEIAKHAPDKHPVAVIRASDGKKRQRVFHDMRNAKTGWLISNYEEIIRRPWQGMFIDLIINNKCAIIADESTRIKNRAAEQTKIAVALAKSCVKRLILTGTPVANTPLDFWAQFKFLGADLGYASFVAFRNQYAILGGFQGHEVVKYQNLEELKRRVAAFSLRRTKDECLDLPPKIYQTVRVGLPEDLQKIYDTMRKDAYLEVQAEQASHEGKVSAAVVISKLLRLSQIAGGTLKLEDGTVTRFKQQPKLDALLATIEEIDPSHSIIIWARFVEEIKMIEETLLARGISCSSNYGETKAEDREQHIRDFQAGTTRVFIGNPHAVGIGITLTKASYVLYYSNDFSWETRVQSEDRCHRIGTTGSVTYIDIVAAGTVDEMLRKALNAKKDLAAYVVEQKINPFKKEEAP